MHFHILHFYSLLIPILLFNSFVFPYMHLKIYFRISDLDTYARNYMFNSYKQVVFHKVLYYKLNYNGSKFELLEIVQILSGDDGGVSFSMLTIYDRPAALGLDLLN